MTPALQDFCDRQAERRAHPETFGRPRVQRLQKVVTGPNYRPYSPRKRRAKGTRVLVPGGRVNVEALFSRALTRAARARFDSLSAYEATVTEANLLRATRATRWHPQGEYLRRLCVEADGSVSSLVPLAFVSVKWEAA